MNDSVFFRNLKNQAAKGAETIKCVFDNYEGKY